MKYFLILVVTLGALVGTSIQDCSPTVKNEILAKHNEFRAQHGSPPLVYDAALNEYAQNWANQLAAKNQLLISPGSKYGENLRSSGSSDPDYVPSGASAVEAWYGQVKNYLFFSREPDNQLGKWGGFTQVVWKGSQKLGIGCGKGNGGNWFLVANYEPAGNVKGEFSNNVLAPRLG